MKAPCCSCGRVASWIPIRSTTAQHPDIMPNFTDMSTQPPTQLPSPIIPALAGVAWFQAICDSLGVDAGPAFRSLLLELCPDLLKVRSCNACVSWGFQAWSLKACCACLPGAHCFGRCMPLRLLFFFS